MSKLSASHISYFYSIDSCYSRSRSVKIAGVRPMTGSPRTVEPPITYHGGPVMANPVMYVIWYGNWTGNNGTRIIENFLRGFGSTAWWRINQAYNNTAPIIFNRSITDNYSQGRVLTDSIILNIVKRAINSTALPYDQNGLYFVFTSADCTETYFCTMACGWYNFDPLTHLKYSFVGDPQLQCPRGCAAQSISPNGNVGADGMVSVIAHEAAEAVSDPELNAWYDAACEENADKCAWTFGNTTRQSNGAYFNMIVNNMTYLVQQNWRLPTEDCGMA